MNRLPCPTGLALATLAVVAPIYGEAADPPTQQKVPFKAAGKGPVRTTFTSIVVPVNPPFVSAHLSVPGESALLGAFTYVAHHTATLDAEGFPRADIGVGALTAANGDAIYVTFSAHPRPTATGAKAEGPFFVTGGSGRFAGATGSGVFTGEIDATRQELRATWEGTISRPAAGSAPSPVKSKPAAAPRDPARARKPR